MKTRLTELLNIKYPIIQGAMAWISEAKLVSAVANAGATGVVSSGGQTSEWILEQVQLTKKLTDKPFGLNIMLMAPNIDDIVEIACKEKVAFATMGAGNPVPYFDKLHAAGVKCIPVVPSVKLAKRVEAAGADALIIEGMEAGGHIGTQTTMSLLENVIPEINIPVIVAGSIVDGRGIAAALLMGAAGVQMGSRFLLAEECTLHPNAKKRIIEATDTDSIVTGYSRGHGVRGIKNKFTDEYLQLEITGAPDEKLTEISIGTNKKAAVFGDIENGLVQVGQGLNRLIKPSPVKDIIEDLMAETKAKLSSAPELIK